MDADVAIGGGTGVHLRIGLFLDGDNDDGEPVRAGGIEQQEGKPAVPGDEAEARSTLGPSICVHFRHLQITAHCFRKIPPGRTAASTRPL